MSFNLFSSPDYARPKHAGSDFTFQVCMLTFFGGTGHLMSGLIAQQFGYVTHFVMSGVVGLFLLLPIVWWHKKRPI